MMKYRTVLKGNLIFTAIAAIATAAYLHQHEESLYERESHAQTAKSAHNGLRKRKIEIRDSVALQTPPYALPAPHETRPECAHTDSVNMPYTPPHGKSLIADKQPDRSTGLYYEHGHYVNLDMQYREMVHNWKHTFAPSSYAWARHETSVKVMAKRFEQAIAQHLTDDQTRIDAHLLQTRQQLGDGQMHTPYTPPHGKSFLNGESPSVFSGLYGHYETIDEHLTAAESPAMRQWKQHEQHVADIAESLSTITSIDIREIIQQRKTALARAGELTIPVGSVDVLRDDLRSLLKDARKLRPLKKEIRKVYGSFSKRSASSQLWETAFDAVTLTATERKLTAHIATLEQYRDYVGEIKSRTEVSFSVTVPLDMLYELTKYLDKERITLEYHEFSKQMVLKQNRYTARFNAITSENMREIYW